MGDHFCLKWNNHQENLTGIMTKLLDEQKFVDVSLVCEMKTFKAHQTILSACSPYFEQVLEENPHPHPIIILRDVKEGEMSALLQYMYRGEVSVRDDELSEFLHTARALKVRGLTESKKDLLLPQTRDEIQSQASSSIAQSVTLNPPKRRRLSGSTSDTDISEKHHGECQQLSSTPNVCKTSPKPSSSVSVTAVLNYSENSVDIHYADTSTPSQGIKQEVESGSAPSDTTCAMSHHLTNMESRSEQSHKMGDWNLDYVHNMESRSYHSQKVELPKVPIPMTYNFSSQLQGPPVPGLYLCHSKNRPKKDQQSQQQSQQQQQQQQQSQQQSSAAPWYEPKPKSVDSVNPGPSYSSSNQTVSVIRNVEVAASIGENSYQTGPGIQRKGGRFRPGWMENYSWLQYDESLNTMYCKTCRKWSSSVPDIRTSFVEGNGNFRLEIVNHHDKSKAHKLCVAKEEESIPSRPEAAGRAPAPARSGRAFRCSASPGALTRALTLLQAEPGGYGELQPSTTSLNPSFTDPGGTADADMFDGSKQWQIKYAFEKIEGSGFKCKICGQIKKHVRNHYLKHFPEHHECHLCRRTYTRKDNLNSHLKRDHFQRVKTPPDPYQRLKRLTKKFEDFQGLKCFTPDVYSQIKYSAAGRNLLNSHSSPLQSQPSPVSGPMDLSLRPSSVPIQPQCAPIYDILPSLYNYFGS